MTGFLFSVGESHRYPYVALKLESGSECRCLGAWLLQRFSESNILFLPVR